MRYNLAKGSPILGQKSSSEEYRWIILAMVFCLMGNYAAAFNTLAPALPLIISEFSITYFQAGLLQGVFNLPGVGLGLLVGLLAKQLGVHRVGMLGTFLIMVGNGIFLLGTSYVHFLLARVVTGVGGVTITVISMIAVSHWFKARDLGVAFGVFTVAYPLFFIVTFNVYGGLAIASGWRTPVIIAVVMSFIAFFGFSVLYKSPAPEEDAVEALVKHRESNETMSMILKATFGAVGLLCISMLFYNAAEMVFITFAPIHFVVIGFSLSEASLLTSVWMLGSLLLGIPTGKLVDRFGHGSHAIILGFLLAASLLMALPFMPKAVYPYLLVGMGLSLGPCWAVALRENAALSPRGHEDFASGFMSSLSEVGYVVGPLVGGFLFDLIGVSFIVFPLVVSLLLTAAILQIVPQILKKKKNPSGADLAGDAARLVSH